MKTYWSAFFLSALLLSSCSQEQFGTAAQKISNPVTSVQTLEQRSCSNLTLINPEVDILYVIDNSSSNWYVPSEVKSAIQNTISSISADFDYRVIGTPLLATSSGNNDYQVLVKNSANFPSALNAKRVNSASEFNFFTGQPIQSSQESGLQRVRDFITAHNTDGLFRQNAYLFIILVSNGRDTTVEQGASWNPQETTLIGNGQNGTMYGDRLNALKQVKSSLNSRQFRLFSLTPSTVGGSSCPSGYLTANKSYVQMSKDLYLDHTPAIDDQGSTNYPDHYNLCSGSVSGVFASVNASIKKIVIPHKYRYWPVTMSATVGLDDATLQVYKENPSSGKVLMNRGSQWRLIANPGNVNTRIEPSPGEPTNAPNVIEFLNGNDIVYPDCISMTSATNTEYFQYIVLTKPAVQNDPQNPIVVKINGVAIPTSAYAYTGYQQFPINIKVAHNGYLETPEQLRSGYMIKIIDSNYYYKSGDNVEVGFKPAPL